MKINKIERKKFRVSNKVKKVASNDRYRLCISRSSKNISAQIIDDKSIELSTSSDVALSSFKIYDISGRLVMENSFNNNISSPKFFNIIF